MPIIGLTTGTPQFPRIGILRKGAEKTSPKRPGSDLQWFRYTSDTNPESVEAFYDAFGKQPNHFTVMLPYQTVDENFEAWQEQWTAARLQHRCDGQHVQLEYDQHQNRYVQPAQPKPCPGGCKPIGRLSLIIPALIKAGHVGTVTLKTTSKHDIMNIDGALKAYYQMRGDLRGIEFILYRYPEQVSTPDGPRREKWLVGLKASHEWVTAQLESMQQRALGAGERPMLAPPNVDLETGEILDDYDDDDVIEGTVTDLPATDDLPPSASASNGTSDKRAETSPQAQRQRKRPGQGDTPKPKATQSKSNGDDVDHLEAARNAKTLKELAHHVSEALDDYDSIEHVVGTVLNKLYPDKFVFDETKAPEYVNRLVDYKAQPAA